MPRRPPARFDDWIACPECDLINRMPDLDTPHTAKCARCGATLYQARPSGLDWALALAVTGLILFALTCSFPLMSFGMFGRTQQNTLFSGPATFWDTDFPELAVLVFLTSVVLPLASLLSLIYVLLPLRLGVVPWQAARVFRLAGLLRPWAMSEVYMLGVFVAVVKLSNFAEIVPGIALYCLGALIVTTAAALWMLDGRAVWRRIEARG